MDCAIPKLTEVPEGEFKCHVCVPPPVCIVTPPTSTDADDTAAATDTTTAAATDMDVYDTGLDVVVGDGGEKDDTFAAEDGGGEVTDKRNDSAVEEDVMEDITEDPTLSEPMIADNSEVVIQERDNNATKTDDVKEITEKNDIMIVDKAASQEEDLEPAVNDHKELGDDMVVDKDVVVAVGEEANDNAKETGKSCLDYGAGEVVSDSKINDGGIQSDSADITISKDASTTAASNKDTEPVTTGEEKLGATDIAVTGDVATGEQKTNNSVKETVTSLDVGGGV